MQNSNTGRTTRKKSYEAARHLRADDVRALPYYEKRGILKRVDGVGDVEEVDGEVVQPSRY